MRPAGRSSIMMPSGVSADTTVSSASTPVAATGAATCILSLMRGSSLDDDRIRDLVVHALTPLTENKHVIDDAIEVADERNRAGDAVDDIAQPEDAGERGRRKVRAHDLDADDLLADRLAVLLDQVDGDADQNQPGDDRDADTDAAECIHVIASLHGLEVGADEHR